MEAALKTLGHESNGNERHVSLLEGYSKINKSGPARSCFFFPEECNQRSSLQDSFQLIYWHGLVKPWFTMALLPGLKMNRKNTKHKVSGRKNKLQGSKARTGKQTEVDRSTAFRAGGNSRAYKAQVRQMREWSRK